MEAPRAFRAGPGEVNLIAGDPQTLVVEAQFPEDRGGGNDGLEGPDPFGGGPEDRVRPLWVARPQRENMNLGPWVRLDRRPDLFPSPASG